MQHLRNALIKSNGGSNNKPNYLAPVHHQPIKNQYINPSTHQKKLHQLPQCQLKSMQGYAGGGRVLLVGALQGCADDAGGIGKNGLVGNFSAGLHQVSKHPGHAAVGNEIGHHAGVLVGKFAGGPKK